MQKSFHQMKRDVGCMHNAKNHRNKSLHSKMIVQSCVTPPCIIQVQGLHMILLSSCYEDSCSYDFSQCASLHLASFDENKFCTCMYTSVKIIQLNEWRCRDAPCEK